MNSKYYATKNKIHIFALMIFYIDQTTSTNLKSNIRYPI